MISFLLAAGYGTRLRPLTWATPKPMVPLCNRPLVAWAVESLLRAGVDEVIVNLHHLPEPIERFLRERYAGRVELHFSFEQEILGTGGALRRVRGLLERAGEFLLANGDTVQFPRWDDLVAARRDAAATAALTLRHPPANDLFTAVWLEDGRITGFGRGRGEPLMFSGAHALSSEILRFFPDREVFGIVDRVYEPLLEAGGTLAAIVDDGLWFDVGTPARYLAANAALLEAMRSGLAGVPEGSSLQGTSVIEGSARAAASVARSSVGPRSVVEGEVRSSLIWSDCRIGPSVRLERCIVTEGVELTGPLDLHDTVVCRDHPAIPADVPREGGLVIARA